MEKGSKAQIGNHYQTHLEYQISYILICCQLAISKGVALTRISSKSSYKYCTNNWLESYLAEHVPVSVVFVINNKSLPLSSKWKLKWVHIAAPISPAHRFIGTSFYLVSVFRLAESIRASVSTPNLRHIPRRRRVGAIPTCQVVGKWGVPTGLYPSTSLIEQCSCHNILNTWYEFEMLTLPHKNGMWILYLDLTADKTILSFKYPVMS